MHSTKTKYVTCTQADITHTPHHSIGRTHRTPKTSMIPNIHTTKKFQKWNTQYPDESHHTYNTNMGKAPRDRIHPYAIIGV